MGVNEGNCVSCYLSNLLKKVSCVVPYLYLIYLSLTLMHHATQVLTPLVWRTHQTSTKLTYLLP
jgi:hypothetical protein